MILGFSLAIIATAIFSKTNRLPLGKVAGTATNPLLIDNKFCDNPASLNQTSCTSFIPTALAQSMTSPYQNVNGDVAISGRTGIGTATPDQKLTVKGGGIGFDGGSADKKLYSPTDGVLEWMTHDWAGTHGFAVSHQGDQRVFLNTNGYSFFSTGGTPNTPNGTLKIGNQGIMFGGTNTAGYEVNSAQISAGTHVANSLNIVGMGTSASARKINMWNEGGLETLGPVRMIGALEVGTGTRGALLNSAVSDNLILTTYTNTPNPNVWIGYGNGAGGLDAAKEFFLMNGGKFMFLNGRVGIGTDSPREQLDVANPNGGRFVVSDAKGGSARALLLQSPGTNTYARLVAHNFGAGQGLNLAINDTGGNVGIGLVAPTYQLQLSRDSAGKPNGGSWANSSDNRLKKNVQPIKNALDKISQLQGINFEWINPAEHGDMSGTQGGFIAQDVEKTFPKWVSRIDPSGSDKNLVPEGDKIESLTLPFEFDALIVEAIKEQQKQINPLLSIVDIVNKVGHFIQIMADRIEAKLIETQKLIVNGVDVLDRLDRQEKEINDLKVIVKQLQEQLQTVK